MVNPFHRQVYLNQFLIRRESWPRKRDYRSCNRSTSCSRQGNSKLDEEEITRFSIKRLPKRSLIMNLMNSAERYFSLVPRSKRRRIAIRRLMTIRLRQESIKFFRTSINWSWTLTSTVGTRDIRNRYLKWKESECRDPTWVVAPRSAATRNWSSTTHRWPTQAQTLKSFQGQPTIQSLTISSRRRIRSATRRSWQWTASKSSWAKAWTWKICLKMIFHRPKSCKTTKSTRH